MIIDYEFTINGNDNKHINMRLIALTLDKNEFTYQEDFQNNQIKLSVETYAQYKNTRQFLEGTLICFSDNF